MTPGKTPANELAVGDTAEAREDGFGLTAGQRYRVVAVHPPFVGVEDEDGERYGVTADSEGGPDLLGNILASRFRRVAVAEVDLGGRELPIEDLATELREGGADEVTEREAERLREAGYGLDGRRLEASDRDRLALGHIKRARASVEEALKAIPNDVHSRFDTTRDVKGLDTIRRELVALELIEDELPPYEPRRSQA